MSTKWTYEDDAYLAINFSSAPMDEMIQHLGRTKFAIYCRAKNMKLHRENSGRFTQESRPEGKPFRMGDRAWNTAAVKKESLRERLIALFVERQELTILDMHKATKSTKSACWRVCDNLRRHGNIHIARYQFARNVERNYEAVYRVGAGVDAVKPDNRRIEQYTAHQPQPVPRPSLGAWGVVW